MILWGQSIYSAVIEGTANYKTLKLDTKPEQLVQLIFQEKFKTADSFSAQIAFQERQSIHYLFALALKNSKQGSFQVAQGSWNQLLTQLPLKNNSINLLFELEYAAHLIRMNRLPEADSCYQQIANNIGRSSVQVNAFLQARFYEQLGLLKYQQSQLHEADTLFQDAYHIWKDFPSLKHLWHFDYWNHHALLLIGLGKYDEAEENFLKAGAILDKIPAGKIIANADLHSNLGTLYRQMGDFNKALFYYKKAQPYYQSLTLDIESSIILNNIALIHDQLDELDLAVKYYEQALALYEDKLGSDNIAYATILNNLAGILDYQEVYEEAEEKYHRSLAAFELILGKNNTYYSTILNNLALVYENTERPMEAEKCFLEAVQIRAQVLGSLHPRYVELQYNLASFYSATNPDKSIELYMDANKKQLDLVKYYYSTFDEETRIEYFNNIDIEFEKFYSIASKNLTAGVRMAIQELNLATKGLSLQYSTDIRSSIKNGSPAVVAEFNQWQKLRDTLSTAWSLSIKQRAEKGISLEELIVQVDQLERNWTRKNKTYQNAPIDLSSLQQELKPNEVAIDFYHFEQFTKGKFRDTVWYYVSIVDPNKMYPTIIKLCSEKSLESILSSGSYPLEYEDQKKKLYHLVWSPLEKYVRNKTKIILSPSGLLHRIPFNGLLEDDQSLISKYEIDLVSNFRDLKDRESPQKSTSHALLMGGLQYNDSPQFNPGQLSGPYPSLPGTLLEINKAQTVLQKKGWSIKSLIKENGTRQHILAQLNERSYKLIHFATHGFAY
ncbi:MAG: CHAT domain-containing protein, partial [Saprospiraceae bacterium]|nr:CHAT domain-containing protein [Saprospiraceae bacterium]